MSHQNDSEYSLNFSDLSAILSDKTLNDKKRTWATNQLAWMYKKDSIEILSRYLNDKSRIIRKTILERIDEIIKNEKIIEPTISDSVLSAIERLTHDIDMEIRKYAIKILVFFENRNEILERILLDALEDPHPEVRTLALQNIPRFLGTNYILPMLYDPNDFVVLEALKQIKQYNLDIPTTIRERLKHHKSLKIRVFFAQHIMDLAISTRKYQFTELVYYLADEIPFLQALAIRTLTKLGHKEILPFIEQKLNNLDENVVIEALRTISHFKHQILKDKVIPFLKDKRRNIRHTAIETLALIGDEQDYGHFLPLINDDLFDIRQTVLDVFTKIIDNRAIIPLIERLHLATLAEKPLLIQILEQYSFDLLIIPLIQAFRNRKFIDNYIREKLGQHFEDLAILKSLKNISLPYLIECLHVEDTADVAQKIIKGWGHKAIIPLQNCLEKMQLHNDRTKEKTDTIKRIEEILKELTRRYQFQVQDGFSLLL
jgi:HEAT repeat protein